MPSDEPPLSPEELQEIAEEDPVVALLLRLKLPVTRENYLEMAFSEPPPDPLPAELEEQLPDFLQIK